MASKSIGFSLSEKSEHFRDEKFAPLFNLVVIKSNLESNSGQIMNH